MRDLDALLPEVYDELRRLAGSIMRGQRRDHTLQPTALIHEAYLKLARAHGLRTDDRAQLLGLAARAMRQVLVDHARAKGRDKRGADLAQVTLPEMAPAGGATGFDLVSLGEALERLEKVDDRQVRIVEMRYLAGLSVEEAAELLGLSPTTVKRETALARAWLIRELG